METLKKFRREKNLTREQMAEKLRISISLYNKIEFGARQPSGNFLKRFKKVFPDFDMNIFFCKLTTLNVRKIEGDFYERIGLPARRPDHYYKS